MRCLLSVVYCCGCLMLCVVGCCLVFVGAERRCSCVLFGAVIVALFVVVVDCCGVVCDCGLLICLVVVVRCVWLSSVFVVVAVCC